MGSSLCGKSVASEMASVAQLVGFCALLVSAFGLTATALNNIQSVEVYTDTCNKCGMTFFSQSELKKHENIHKVMKAYMEVINPLAAQNAIRNLRVEIS